MTFTERLCVLALAFGLSLTTTGCGDDGANTLAPSGGRCNSDAGPTDARIRADADPGAESGEALPEAGACPVLLFTEDFEGSAAGAALDPAWALVVEGPNSSARVNLDIEGHGQAASSRFALFTNAGSYPNQVQISATRGPFDVRSCASARLTAAVIVFSLEQSEDDHAFVEVRGNGGDWIPMAMPFPSNDFPSNAACRAGGQETGCTAWMTIAVDVPRVALGPDFEVRFRSATLTDVSDFFGFDDVTLAGVP